MPNSLFYLAQAVANRGDSAIPAFLEPKDAAQVAAWAFQIKQGQQVLENDLLRRELHDARVEAAITAVTSWHKARMAHWAALDLQRELDEAERNRRLQERRAEAEFVALTAYLGVPESPDAIVRGLLEEAINCGILAGMSRLIGMMLGVQFELSFFQDENALMVYLNMTFPEASTSVSAPEKGTSPSFDNSPLAFGGIAKTA